MLWVGGPGVVHTGAAPAMVAMVEAGFVDVLFAGNALATHDIESSLYGTSLGVDLAHGHGVEHGHEHHIRALNTIRKEGSIKAAVDNGVLTGGIMHALVTHDKEFVLVGSVRDDGPLPDVYTDVIEGQRAMRAEPDRRRLLPDGGDHAPLGRDRQHPPRLDPAGLRRHQPGHGHQARRPRVRRRRAASSPTSASSSSSSRRELVPDYRRPDLIGQPQPSQVGRATDGAERSRRPGRRPRARPPAARRGARHPPASAASASRAGSSSRSPASETPPPTTHDVGVERGHEVGQADAEPVPDRANACRATRSPSAAAAVTIGPVNRSGSPSHASDSTVGSAPSR